MKKLLLVMTASVLVLGSFQPAGAADDQNRPTLGEWQQRLEAIQQQEETKAARAVLVAEILEAMQPPGRTLDEGWARRMESLLNQRSLAELRQAQDLLGQGERLTGALIGSVTGDLAFTPLDKPCRFYDSRNTVGGRLTPGGADRTFVVKGVIPTGQGGSLNCGVPTSAVAVVVNVLAVSPLAQGNFQMWPSDGTPGDSVINYGGPALGINLINGVMVPVCNSFLGLCPTDLILRTNFAASHAVVNVTGYFSPPELTPLVCTTVETVQEVGTSAFNFTSPSCPAGTNLTGGGHNWTTNTQDVWFWEVSPEDTRYRCRGRNFNATASQITCFARCCGIGFAL